MDYNYHTHTFRCGHATGKEIDYVKRAVDCGVKYMGFSDHVPFVFPGGHEDSYRVQMSDVKDYFETIRKLANDFKDKIEILVGFEAEFYPEFSEKMLKGAIDLGAQYLILGQHFIGNEVPDYVLSYSVYTDPEVLKKYTECVISGMKTGLFTYVAHPDIVAFVGDNAVYDEQMRKICKKSKELNVPLEINLLGIRENRKYPDQRFWKIAGEENSPVTFGFDAHDVDAAYDGESLKVAKEMVKKFALNYIGKPEIVRVDKAL